MVVGAVYHTYDADGANHLAGAGAAFVFARTNGVWSLQQKLYAPSTITNGRLTQDYFGGKSSIFKDTIAIGASGHDYDQDGANFVTDAGAVFIFTRSNGVWTFQQKITDQGTNGRVASDVFGAQLSVHDDIIALGSQPWCQRARLR